MSQFLKPSKSKRGIQKSLPQLKKQIEKLAKQVAKERDNYICQKCLKKVSGSNAHGSHVIPVSRGDALRFDLLNIKCLCYHCHLNWWHKNPIEAGDWFKQAFPDRWAYLDKHKNDIVSRSREELERILQDLQRML